MMNHLYALRIIVILLSFFTGLAPLAEAQDCGLQFSHQKLYEKDAVYQKRNDALNLQLAAATPFKDETIYTIPVVVHIIHQPGANMGTGGNISDQQVFDAISALNDGFSNQGNYYDNVGINIRFEFCLASVAPNGQSTNGITRTASWQDYEIDSATEEPSFKAATSWDTKKYMNIWVVNGISNSAQGVTNVVGYTYLASAHGYYFDGVTIEADYFGTTLNNNKALIHEVGHYLNLEHTFNGGCNNSNCMLQGDYVCDTPPDNSSSYFSCDSPPNTCSTDDDDNTAQNPFRPVWNGGLGDVADMLENYMDYGYKNCQTRFTEGQKTRMRQSFLSYRSSLLQSNVCAITPPVQVVDAGIEKIILTPDNCNENFSATAVVKNYGQETITSMQMVYLFNNQPLQSFVWNGYLAAGSSTNVFINNFSSNNAGSYSLTVLATNANNNGNDSNTNNDQANSNFYNTAYQSVPFTENFNSGSIGNLVWNVKNPDNGNTWATKVVPDCNSSNQTAAFIKFYNNNNYGAEDYMEVKLDLSTYNTASLQFDVAYAMLNSYSNDALQVAVAENCNGIFNEIYYKNAWNLNTSGSFMTAEWQPSACSQWRKETVNLDAYAGKKILLRFKAINGDGNNLYLDNIKVNAAIQVPCNVPNGLQASNITENGAFLSWQPNLQATQYSLAYRIAAAYDWNYVTIYGNTYTAQNLQAATYYECKVAAVCAAGSQSEYSAVQGFTTATPYIEPPTPTDTTTITDPEEPQDTTIIITPPDLSCAAPSFVSVYGIGQDVAQLSWEKSNNAIGYNIRVRREKTEQWDNYYTGDLWTPLNNLEKLSDYQVEIYSICTQQVSQVPATLSFSTYDEPCAAVKSLHLGNISTSSAVVSWQLSNTPTLINVYFRNKSEVNWNQYAVNNTNEATLWSLQPDSEYEAYLLLQCGTAYSIPSDTLNFKTQKIISCDAPFNLSTESVAANSVKLQWDNTGGAIQYEVSYKSEDGKKWKSINTYDKSCWIGDLAADSKYIWQVKSFCADGGESPVSETAVFSTKIAAVNLNNIALDETPCSAITAFKPVFINTNDAYFVWSEIAEENAVFTVRCRTILDMVWVEKSEDDAAAYLSDLTPLTTYQIQIQKTCGSKILVSETLVFTTLPSCATPQQLRATRHDVFSTLLTWQATDYALAYVVEYGEQDGSVIYSDTTSAAHLYIDHLNFCSDYWARVKTLCSNNNNNYSETIYFSTSHCNGETACNGYGFNSQHLFIDSLAIAGTLWQHKSGDNDGYLPLRDTLAALELGAGYQLDIICGGGSNRYFTIWIDYNHNQQYESWEQTATSGEANMTALAFALPDYITPNYYALRIIAADAPIAADAACDYVFTGEAEDYWLEILPKSGGKKGDNATAAWECSVFPLPARDVVYYHLHAYSGAVYSLELYDISGKLLLLQTQNDVAQGQISTAHLSSGVYLLRIVSEQQVLQAKVVVE